MTGLMRGYGLNFHMNYKEAGEMTAMSFAGEGSRGNGKEISIC